MSNKSIDIRPAEHRDLPAILALQKLAYRSEAELLNDYAIQPLRQTIDQLETEYHKGEMLKAVDPHTDDTIVGSIRGYVDAGTLHLGKLMVHPEFQRRGIGSRLILALERSHPDVRYELFTTTRSVGNLALYHRLGYRDFKYERRNDVDMVILQKNA